jgi:hypothetical protein
MTKAINESLEATELEKLIHKCINLQNIIEKGTKTSSSFTTTNVNYHAENNTIEALENEYNRWSSKFPEHESGFEAYVTNSVRRRSVTNDANSINHLLVKGNANNNMMRTSMDNQLSSAIKGIELNTENEDDTDDYTKIINQIFPFQEGNTTTTTITTYNCYYLNQC